MRVAALASALLLTGTPSFAAVSTWSIDPAHSQSGFTVKHLVISTVRGDFGKSTGQVVIDDADITRSSVEAIIDIDSLNTGQADRDKHLKSADFFDSATYPSMIFKSTRVTRAGQGKLRVTGDLTLHGTTKPVVLEVEGPSPQIKGMGGEARRALTARTQINRQDYGLTWSKTIEAGPVVGDLVKVELSIELVKAADSTAPAATTK